MSIKEEIHALTDEMLTNLGRLVAIDSQLGIIAGCRCLIIEC